MRELEIGAHAGESRAAQLRREFDAAFAQKATYATAETEALLAIRIGAEPFALRVPELANIARCGKVVPIPSGSAALMGLAGIKGAIVPVYSLPALLNLPQTGAMHWLALCGKKNPIALAFSEFEHYFSAGRTAFCAAEAATNGHIREIVQSDDGVRSIVDIPSILKTIFSPEQPDGLR